MASKFYSVISSALLWSGKHPKSITANNTYICGNIYIQEANSFKLSNSLLLSSLRTRLEKSSWLVLITKGNNKHCRTWYAYLPPHLRLIDIMLFCIASSLFFKAAEIKKLIKRNWEQKYGFWILFFYQKVHNGTEIIFSELVAGILFVSACIGIIGAGELRTKRSQFQNCRL